jgi:hypothetical protein
MALPLAKSRHSTSIYRSYTEGRMWLNFVIKACFSQSTATSESITVATGYCTLDEIRGSGTTRTDRIVQAKPWPGIHLKLLGTAAEKSNSVPLSSMRFRIAIKVIIKESWKRSTMSVGYYWHVVGLGEGQDMHLHRLSEKDCPSRIF